MQNVLRGHYELAIEAAPPLRLGHRSTFPGLQDLDFGQAITGQFIREVCNYWIDVFGIDGIRFDNTTNYYVPTDPLHGLQQVLANVTDHVRETAVRTSR